MSAPRLRRLHKDYEWVQKVYFDHPHVIVRALDDTSTPERYVVDFNVTGAAWDPERDRPVRVHTHRVEIFLPAEYPRQEPHCVMATGYFHPNIGLKNGINHFVCIGDAWNPTQQLWETIAKVGEMLQYQDYNTDSPLDRVAARWTLDNPSLFPLGDVQMFQREGDVQIERRPDDGGSSGRY